ncbi:hypothetical protein BKA93DRAFT_881909 [Sparassis latifolia]
MSTAPTMHLQTLAVLFCSAFVFTTLTTLGRRSAVSVEHAPGSAPHSDLTIPTITWSSSAAAIPLNNNVSEYGSIMAYVCFYCLSTYQVYMATAGCAESVQLKHNNRDSVDVKSCMMDRFMIRFIVTPFYSRILAPQINHGQYSYWDGIKNVGLSASFILWVQQQVFNGGVRVVKDVQPGSFDVSEFKWAPVYYFTSYQASGNISMKYLSYLIVGLPMNCTHPNEPGAIDRSGWVLPLGIHPSCVPHMGGVASISMCDAVQGLSCTTVGDPQKH